MAKRRAACKPACRWPWGGKGRQEGWCGPLNLTSLMVVIFDNTLYTCYNFLGLWMIMDVLFWIIFPIVFLIFLFVFFTFPRPPSASQTLWWLWCQMCYSSRGQWFILSSCYRILQIASRLIGLQKDLQFFMILNINRWQWRIRIAHFIELDNGFFYRKTLFFDGQNNGFL